MCRCQKQQAFKKYRQTISFPHTLHITSQDFPPQWAIFLSQILNRPANEKPYLLLPVGYAKKEAYVPTIQRKNIEEILLRY